MALAELFFLEAPGQALIDPSLTSPSVSLRINRVARARYANCHIENRDAETFAAVDVTLVSSYWDESRKRDVKFEIPGLMVAGKGIKPSSIISAGLKGLRFEQELQTRAVNLGSNEVNPPLSDVWFAKWNLKETGFYAPVVDALSSKEVAAVVGAETGISPMVPFGRAAKKAALLAETVRRASPLAFYRAEDTLESVMAKCVAAGSLDARWLPKEGYAAIGYAR